jgi:hypothetical protein
MGTVRSKDHLADLGLGRPRVSLVARTLGGVCLQMTVGFNGNYQVTMNIFGHLSQPRLYPPEGQSQCVRHVSVWSIYSALNNH